MARFGDAAGGGLHLQVQVSVSKRGIREQSTVTLCSWEIQSELDSPHAARMFLQAHGVGLGPDEL